MNQHDPPSGTLSEACSLNILRRLKEVIRWVDVETLEADLTPFI